MSEFPPAPSTRPRAARVPDVVLTSPFWAAASGLWFVALFVLSSIPGGGGPDLPTHSDKAAHFLFFAGGGAVLAAALSLRNPPPRPLAIAALTLAAGALTGAFDEWHQTFTANRAGLDTGDWIADVLGTAAGLAGARIALRRLRANGAFVPTRS